MPEYTVNIENVIITDHVVEADNVDAAEEAARKLASAEIYRSRSLTVDEQRCDTHCGDE